MHVCLCVCASNIVYIHMHKYLRVYGFLTTSLLKFIETCSSFVRGLKEKRYARVNYRQNDLKFLWLAGYGQRQGVAGINVWSARQGGQLSSTLLGITCLLYTSIE